MSSEDHIIRKLEIIDQSDFERLIDNLLYNGAFPEICPRNSFVETFGVNPGKNRTVKSPSHSDAEIRYSGAAIEKSVEKIWASKLKKDVAKNKKSGRIIKKFVFCTNQDTGNKRIKIGKNTIDAVKYCENELECTKCYIIGQRELLHPLQNPNFFFLRRSFLSIDDDFFCNPFDYYKRIQSNGAVACDLSQDVLGSFAEEIDKEISFQSKGVIVLHNDDYIPLIHAIGLWAIQKLKNSKGVLDEDYSFIKWPSNVNSAGENEVNQDLNSFIVVWGANEIDELSGYLRFVNERTTLIFVCRSAFKDKGVINKIESFNKDIVIQEISLASIDERTVSTNEVSQHQRKVKTTIQDTLDLVMRLEALIYYYSPFYINDIKRMKKIQDLLNINSKQLNQLIDVLKGNDFGQLTGNILWLKHPSVARKLLGNFIDQEVLSIDHLV